MAGKEIDTIDTSLRTDDVFKLPAVEEDGSNKEVATTSSKETSSKEISIDLDNMLQEIQDERDSGQLKFASSEDSNSCISLVLNISVEGGNNSSDNNNDDDDDDDSFDIHHSPQHHMNRIGSDLQLEDLPSSNYFGDSWWSSGSIRGSFGSFRKRMGGSLRKLYPYQQRRKDDIEGDEGSSITPSTNSERQQQDSNQQQQKQQSWRKKKAVRFKKFDTIFPFYKSFSRLQRQLSEDEGSIQNNH